MITRQQRRRKERQARKETPNTGRQTVSTRTDAPNHDLPLAEALDYSFQAAESPAPPTRAEINRQNAQQSTGPRTEASKTVSSQNAVRHGLSSRTFLVLDWENQDEFAELLVSLRAEHQPRTATEDLLIQRMAQHFWLSQRAIRLQDLSFRRDLPYCHEPKELALYMRYQTTHDRAFHRCLSDLLKLRAEQRKAEAGFVSQQHKAAAETRKQELHELRLKAAKAPHYPRPSSAKPQHEPVPAVATPQPSPASDENRREGLAEAA
jgi:hypothetical protein